MAKRIVNGGATVTVKKTIMKRRKKKTIHKVVDYLISDSYLFAPLISSNPPFNYSRSTPKGIEFRERRKDNRSLVKKIEDYLKSDCYMYAPLIFPQTRGRGCLKKVTTEIMSESAANMKESRTICTPDNQLAKDSPRFQIFSLRKLCGH
ncbi:uncharacterized protein LOC111007025 isoform X1 [Momordica charantia]|uniref:Uncharacterized protein LOC111007025 isoform X1 n=1 Tax=Momordica charantia TaxID=3673 RepID=A0A6J1C0T7_MOMCH|nr:uncharacterized protein LOC111007025 isoform X1 [Momordica charantia]XP_022134858.1 uncharacterized protein LOC111007025 isoform X1 [Momordica charantia]XP_022134859.1 uncharacterized protein LOC111007025 isoform X1 [Momordica charantia]